MNTLLHTNLDLQTHKHTDREFVRQGCCRRELKQKQTHDVPLLAHGFLSGNLWVLQILEELIQAVGLAPFPPLPQLIGHQWGEAARKHLHTQVHSIHFTPINIHKT